MAEETQLRQIKEFSSLTMFAESPDGSYSKRPKLTFAMADYGPRITVFTNGAGGDTDQRGIIPAPMDANCMVTLLAMLEDIAKGKPGNTRNIDNYTKPANGEKIKLSETLVGKDEAGIVWISVTAPNRPLIRFKFLSTCDEVKPLEFHRFRSSLGDPIDNAMLSKYNALGMIRQLEIVYGITLAEHKRPASTNRPAGYQQPQPNQSAQQQPTESNALETDIPF